MSTTSPGRALFARYAFPPNELGYCGPDGGDAAELGAHAKEFDGAWPYLTAIAEWAKDSDPLDEHVVRSYWVGGPALSTVDPGSLLARLRAAFRGQVTGLLDEVSPTPHVLAHHSFHVFVVYPWIRFLSHHEATAIRVMQACRIRWGTVESVAGEQVTVTSQPLIVDEGRLTLGQPRPELVRWKKGELSLGPVPATGATVSMHWDWVCGTLTEDEAAALASATRATLALVNEARPESVPAVAGVEQTGG